MLKEQYITGKVLWNPNQAMNKQEDMQILTAHEFGIFITWYEIPMASLASEAALLLTFEQFIA